MSCTVRDRFSRVTEYIDSHLGEIITIDNLANRVALSRFHFARTFKRRFGCTPLTYITERRMQRAHTLLLTTPLPVEVVAAAVGFSNVSHFRRLIRRYFAISPGWLRRQRLVQTPKRPAKNSKDRPTSRLGN